MKKATRVSFGEQLAALGESDASLVVFDADLAKSTQSLMFGKKFPERFFDMGIQEQNMIGTAAGMALMGKRPFVCSFSTFVIGRFETIRMSVAYSNANVKIVGTHCGIGVGEDGYSQMALEDIALMRTLPNMHVLQPADDIETRAAVRWLASSDTPAFLRLTRQAVPDVHDAAYTFEFGKADELLHGTTATILATGAVVANALEAARRLAADGHPVRVANIHTIKPIDVAYVAKAARETGRIITVEDHSVIGGLGGAVAEVLSEHAPARLLRIGIQDRFGESGSPDELYVAHGLDADGIERRIRLFLA